MSVTDYCGGPLVVAPKPVVYHSEYGQDRWLDQEIFRERRNGVFVEVGALDGLLHSNSLFFEGERGWSGLLVEANPRCARDLRNNRPNAKIDHCAVYDHMGSVFFEVIQGGFYGWSGIADEIEREHRSRISEHVSQNDRQIVAVHCKPLDIVLRDSGLHRIDYLSLDVEGAEPPILRGFPFSQFDIDVIGVENNFGRPEVGQIMTANGYEKIGRVGADDFYRRPR